MKVHGLVYILQVSGIFQLSDLSYGFQEQHFANATDESDQLITSPWQSAPYIAENVSCIPPSPLRTSFIKPRWQVKVLVNVRCEISELRGAIC